MRTLIVVVASSVAIWLGADLRAQQPDPAGFQQVVELHVKPGQQAVFERFAREVVAAANKLGAPQTWMMFQSEIGREGAIYRVVLPFTTWGERDAWIPVPEMLVKARGQEQAEKLLMTATNWSNGITTRIWENLPGGTSNPTPQPANFYQVTMREVRPDMVDEYQALIAKFKAAYEASPAKLTVTRSVLRVGAGSSYTFRRAEAFDRWSDLDGRSAQAILNKHFGDQEAARLIETLQRAIVRQDTFVSMLRRDLSRMPTS